MGRRIACQHIVDGASFVGDSEAKTILCHLYKRHNALPLPIARTQPAAETRGQRARPDRIRRKFSVSAHREDLFETRSQTPRQAPIHVEREYCSLVHGTRRGEQRPGALTLGYSFRELGVVETATAKDRATLRWCLFASVCCASGAPVGQSGGG